MTNDTSLPAQLCPVCRASVTPSPRYRDYLCRPCTARARSADGRPVAFHNASVSGGCEGRYRDTDEPYPDDLCHVDGIACRAAEAHFGGIVIRPLPA